MKSIPDQSISYDHKNINISDWLKKYKEELVIPFSDNMLCEEVERIISKKINKAVTRYFSDKDRYKKLSSSDKKKINERGLPHNDLIESAKALLDAYRKNPYPLDNQIIDESLKYNDVYLCVENMIEHLEGHHWHINYLIENGRADKSFFNYGQVEILNLKKNKENLVEKLCNVCVLHIENNLKKKKATTELVGIVFDNIGLNTVEMKETREFYKLINSCKWRPT